MKTIKVTEKYDGSGKLIERTVETTDNYELAPFSPQPTIVPIPVYPPIYPSYPQYPPYTITCGNVCGGSVAGAIC